VRWAGGLLGRWRGGGGGSGGDAGASALDSPKGQTAPSSPSSQSVTSVGAAAGAGVGAEGSKGASVANAAAPASPMGGASRLLQFVWARNSGPQTDSPGAEGDKASHPGAAEDAVAAAAAAARKAAEQAATESAARELSAEVAKQVGAGRGRAAVALCPEPPRLCATFAHQRALLHVAGDTPATDSLGIVGRFPVTCIQVAKKLAQELEEAKGKAVRADAEARALVEALVQLKLELADAQGGSHDDGGAGCQGATTLRLEAPGAGVEGRGVRALLESGLMARRADWAEVRAGARGP
jgi:hypothetical protein